MENIYQQIREIRMAQGMTQGELCERTGLMQPSLSRIEKGEMNVGMETIVKILAALGKQIQFTELAEPYAAPLKIK